MVALGISSINLLAVRVRLLPAVTGLGLAVKEPTCGPAARKRATAKAWLFRRSSPTSTISPFGWMATASLQNCLIGTGAATETPLVPKVVSGAPFDRRRTV